MRLQDRGTMMRNYAAEYARLKQLAEERGFRSVHEMRSYNAEARSSNGGQSLQQVLQQILKDHPELVSEGTSEEQVIQELRAMFLQAVESDSTGMDWYGEGIVDYECACGYTDWWAVGCYGGERQHDCPLEKKNR
jgi:hypothetical protein